MSRFRIEILSSAHDRTEFQSGVDPLDKYFRERVSQDVRRRVTACYVAFDSETPTIAGYYTLAAGSVPLVDVPAALAVKLPRYNAVPVARLGRLAVDRRYRGQRLGAALLWDALTRAIRSEVAVFALVVDAKDAQAAAFYRHFGFVEFGSLPNRLLLPLTTIKPTSAG